MASFARKYRHGFLMLGYSIFYLMVFRYLESRSVPFYHVVHTVFDDKIPFCEFFIVPYLLWFPYMILAVLYFIFINKDKREYYQLAGNMIMGMTIFLDVSYLYPNVQHLRPVVLPRDNVFADAVRMLYATDTPTNILPSIHVFNSLAIHMSLTNCQALRHNRVVRLGSLFLTVMIILSTMFLKQHSVIDVSLGCTMAVFGFLLFYPVQVRELYRKPEQSRLWS